MFYDAIENKHGLRHDPYKTLVAPRPIGWISSLDPDGVVNLAPYSFFNAVSTHPKVVFFSSEGHKDSLRNVEATGEFVCNLVPYDLREQMNQTSAAWPRETDEFEDAGIIRAPCREIACSRVAGAPANLECRAREIIRLAGAANFMVIGEVVGVHLRDDCLREGRFDITLYEPVARLGYMDYTRVTSLFEMTRPG